MVVYLRGHEGRGIGLVAEARRRTRCRTPAATPSTPTPTWGCPSTPATTPSPQRFSPTSGSDRVRLLTNNPAKVDGLARYGVEVARREPLLVEATAESVRYLRAKQERLGHDLPHVPRSAARESRTDPLLEGVVP